MNNILIVHETIYSTKFETYFDIQYQHIYTSCPVDDNLKQIKGTATLH